MSIEQVHAKLRTNGKTITRMRRKFPQLKGAENNLLRIHVVATIRGAFAPRLAQFAPYALVNSIKFSDFKHKITKLFSRENNNGLSQPQHTGTILRGLPIGKHIN